MKRVLMVIAQNKFRDEEYKEPRDVIEKAGIKVEVASETTQTATGKSGMKVKPDLALKEVDVKKMDAVIFVGGPGSYDYFDHPIAQEIAKNTIKEGKILAAICAAPSILANAGLLKDKRVTCFPGEGQNLKNKGANYTGSGLEIDGKIITADGPAHAKQFGEAIVKALS
jgi:protease I